MTYSKKRFLSNLAYLMKKKNIRIGEIETAANLSAGYFSRIKGEENDSQCPNIEALYAIAEKLEVTLDFLLNSDLETLTETEEYILNFLNVVTTSTQNKKMDWEKEYKERSDGNSKHILNDVIALTDEDGDCYGQEVLYNSLFTNKLYKLKNDICWLDWGERKLLLTQVVEINKQLNEMDSPAEYELYMVIGKDRKKIVNGSPDTKRVFYKTLENLYAIALKSTEDVRLDTDVKKEMKNILDTIDLPF